MNFMLYRMYLFQDTPHILMEMAYNFNFNEE